MNQYALTQAIQLCADLLEDIDHWDGRNLNVEQLEQLIGGIEWDLKVLLNLLKEVAPNG